MFNGTNDILHTSVPFHGLGVTEVCSCKIFFMARIGVDGDLSKFSLVLCNNVNVIPRSLWLEIYRKEK